MMNILNFLSVKYVERRRYTAEEREIGWSPHEPTETKNSHRKIISHVLLRPNDSSLNQPIGSLATKNTLFHLIAIHTPIVRIG